MITSQPCPWFEPNPSYTHLSLSIFRPSHQMVLAGLKCSIFGSWSLSTHNCYWWHLDMDLIFATSSTTSTFRMSHSTLEILIFTWSHTLSTISDLDHLFLFLFLFFLFFTKPSVEMIATLCNNHLTLRSLISKLVFILKTILLFLL